MIRTEAVPAGPAFSKFAPTEASPTCSPVHAPSDALTGGGEFLCCAGPDDADRRESDERKCPNAEPDLLPASTNPTSTGTTKHRRYRRAGTSCARSRRARSRPAANRARPSTQASSFSASNHLGSAAVHNGPTRCSSRNSRPPEERSAVSWPSPTPKCRSQSGRRDR